MKRNCMRLCSLFLCLVLFVGLVPFANAEDDLGLSCKSAILIEEKTGKVLYEMNAHEKMPPASITKVMSLLLVMEAIESGKITLQDTPACSDHAASMGGSQIWLAPGETMTVNDLLKATCVASANDAIVDLAEYVAGSEDAFVQLMNERAKELGMEDTTFKNATGLDADGHLTSAYDIALMSRALLAHDLIKEYSTIWMDSLRDGKSELTNTNKLVRFYDGCTGLKTGTTDGAGSCVSASATRNGLSLVAVVMGAPTSKDRFASASKQLDFGFANWAVASPEDQSGSLAPIPVLRGVRREVEVKYEPLTSILVPKGKEKEVAQEIQMQENVTAPVESGQVVGKVVVKLDGEVIGESPITTTKEVEKMTLGRAFQIFLTEAIRMKNS